MKVWLDGALHEEQDARVSAFDHGLTVGDGVFETTKVIAGVPFALTRHLARLARSAAGLGLPAPHDATICAGIAAVLATAADTRPLRLRITYTGGVAPLGSDRGSAPPTLIIATAPLTPWAPTTSLATVPWARNERGATAGLKTTSYAENVIALAHARKRGAAEALFANTRGELCEGTGSNVFLVLAGELITPPLTSGCLAGVTRGLVLAWCGGREQDLPLPTLGRAEEVFITSATRDVLPVHAVDGRPLDAPGPVTTAAMEAFAAGSAQDPDP
jgi:branched-chain amino acid aminotransferase